MWYLLKLILCPICICLSFVVSKFSLFFADYIYKAFVLIISFLKYIGYNYLYTRRFKIVGLWNNNTGGYCKIKL
jgi:hypothetical protein